MKIDLNCDVGEGMPNDAALMQYISSANIACGFHAGDRDTIKRTMELALKHHVAIGAHPGFADKNNFGRTGQQLSENEYYDLVASQIVLMQHIATSLGAKLHHVKPHGALYNMAAKDKALAAVIAKAIKDTDASLLLYGLSGSYMIAEANALELRTASEVFADRTYTSDAKLTPRSQPGALIEDTDTAIQQVLQMIKTQTVCSTDNKIVQVKAETVCLHGDGLHAVDFARKIHHLLHENSIRIETV